jgi:hydroxypyruvate reductase
MFDAAIAAALPDKSLPAYLPKPPKGRTLVVGCGKAAASMAKAVEDHWKGELSGLVVTRYGHKARTRKIEVVEAAHPVPDLAGREAAERILKLVQELSADDLVLFLVSGGGSALLALPAPGLTLTDKQAINKALLKSGANITEMNCVRKHLSRIKGGRLARAGSRAAEIVTLAISDVPHDDPSAIASGPTVPDPTTLADARALVAKYNLAIDDAVRRALDDPNNESCKPGDAAFAHATFELIAKPKASLDAAIRIAADAGYAVIDLGADLEGEAREVAAAHAKLALKARAEGKRIAILSGGELTVTVRGNGRGGPNQEYALALADMLKETPDIAALAGDTDGADGGAGSASDPAGAVIDQNTFAKMKSLGLDPKAYLDNNDATAFFAATGDLLLTGPTLTNVNDVRVILVE